MDFSTYQRLSRKTALYPRRGKNVVYPTLGLAGESGEVAEKIKKMIRDDRGRLTKERRQELANELGDVLWYLSNLASELKLRLEDVAVGNLTKLRGRKKRGTLKGSGDTR